MTDSADLVIRGGMIADGSGGELFEADVAIKDGRIIEVGKVAAKGREEIDAKGKLVAPGFVDVHTHYDGQVTWSHDMTPSSQNGVTTAIMGNCGVGFAPCRPSDHQRLIQLMEGVEDIPEPVLSAGIPWAWESFPDYMEWLSKRHFDVDIGAQLPHARLASRISGIVDNLPASPDAHDAAVIDIPVCYGGEFGPDLDNVAANAKLSADAAIALHCAAAYRVAMLGFAPGFPYLLGLDPALHTPRRANPRTRVPAGAVAIGGAQTGIYPRELPGGWQIIGRTPLALFDAARNPAALLAPGQSVRFSPIGAGEFAALAQ